MIRSCIALCLAIALGACQAEPPTDGAGTEADEPGRRTAEVSQDVLGCMPGPMFCNTPAQQPPWWQGQALPIAGAGQSYHLYTSPLNKNETILSLADINQGKIVYAVKASGAQSAALLAATWGRGPVDVVRPPPPPPPIGTEALIMERAIRFQQIEADALKAVEQCGF
jgi:hypothetical protein